MVSSGDEQLTDAAQTPRDSGQCARTRGTADLFCGNPVSPPHKNKIQSLNKNKTEEVGKWDAVAVKKESRKQTMAGDFDCRGASSSSVSLSSLSWG